MRRLQGASPMGEWVNFTADCNLNTIESKQIRQYNVLKTTDSTQVSITSNHPPPRPPAASYTVYPFETSM